ASESDELGSPARPPPGPHPLLAALWLAVADQLGHLVLKAPPLLLIAGVLHRREIALHLAILVAIDLLQRELVLLPRGHQLLHAVFVGRSRGQLGVQGLVDLALPRAHRLALLLEPLLGGLHLPCLVVAQTQRRAHMLVPAMPDLATQLLRLRRVRVGERARVALLLRPERRRHSAFVTAPVPSSSTTVAATLSHADCIHSRVTTLTRGASRSRVTTACAVRSTSSCSAARAPSRCASFSSSCSFTPGTPSTV